MSISFYNIQNGNKIGEWQNANVIPSVGDEVAVNKEYNGELSMGCQPVYHVLGRMLYEDRARLYVVHKSNIFASYDDKYSENQN